MDTGGQSGTQPRARPALCEHGPTLPPPRLSPTPPSGSVRASHPPRTPAQRPCWTPHPPPTSQPTTGHRGQEGGCSNTGSGGLGSWLPRPGSREQGLEQRKQGPHPHRGLGWEGPSRALLRRKLRYCRQPTREGPRGPPARTRGPSSGAAPPRTRQAHSEQPTTAASPRRPGSAGPGCTGGRTRPPDPWCGSAMVTAPPTPRPSGPHAPGYVMG